MKGSSAQTVVRDIRYSNAVIIQSIRHIRKEFSASI